RLATENAATLRYWPGFLCQGRFFGGAMFLEYYRSGRTCLGKKIHLSDTNRQNWARCAVSLEHVSTKFWEFGFVQNRYRVARKR
ncbi:MAG: hypothetical protein AAB339_03575, partial [Elusimicrobiota bacterium]